MIPIYSLCGTGAIAIWKARAQLQPPSKAASLRSDFGSEAISAACSSRNSTYHNVFFFLFSESPTDKIVFARSTSVWDREPLSRNPHCSAGPPHRQTRNIEPYGFFLGRAFSSFLLFFSARQLPSSRFGLTQEIRQDPLQRPPPPFTGGGGGFPCRCQRCVQPTS